MTDTRAPGAPDVQGPASRCRQRASGNGSRGAAAAHSPRKPPISRTGCCAPSPRWKTCAAAPSARSRTARIYGVANFARDVVGVADNMRRALDAVGADMREKADGGVKALIDGIELTERELLKALEKHGVQKARPGRAEVRSESAPGDVRDTRRDRSHRHSGAGRAVRLHDR